MKSKQLALLLAVAVALGVVAWILKRNNDDTWSDTAGGAGGKVIELAINDVARVAIQSSGGTVNLVKKDDVWAVQERGDYPANFERVGDLLRKLWDLKTVQTLQAGPSQLARFDLTEPDNGAGTRVSFQDKDGKSLGALLLGKKFMKKADGPMGDMGGFPAGRYVMPVGGATVSLVSENLDEAEAKPESWLKRDFIKVENPSVITLAGPTDAQKWKLTRDTAAGEWKLSGAKAAEKLDAAKVSLLSGVFANASFSDVLNPDAKPADTGLDNPTVITFDTFDRFTYLLKVGKAIGDNQPVAVEVAAQLAKERMPGKDEKPGDKTKLDEEFKATLKRLEEKLAAEKKFAGRPFLIAKTTLDSIIKDRTALFPDKNAEPAPGSANLPPGHPGMPAARAASSGRAPISVTTPPIAVPPAPKVPPAKPAVAEKPKAPAAKPAVTAVPAAPATNAAKPERPRLIGAEPPNPPKPEQPAVPPNKP